MVPLGKKKIISISTNARNEILRKVTHKLWIKKHKKSEKRWKRKMAFLKKENNKKFNDAVKKSLWNLIKEKKY